MTSKELPQDENHFRIICRESRRSSRTFPSLLLDRASQQLAKLMFHANLISACRYGNDGTFALDLDRVARVIRVEPAHLDQIIQQMAEAGLVVEVSKALPCSWGGFATTYRWIGPLDQPEPATAAPGAPQRGYSR